MAARVRLKMQCGTVVLLFVVIVVVCAMDLVRGMFEHRHCSHQHPRPHEVSVAKRKEKKRKKKNHIHRYSQLSRLLFLCHSFFHSRLTFVVCLFARQTLAGQLDCRCSFCQLPPRYLSLLLFYFPPLRRRFSLFVASNQSFAPPGMKSRDFEQACVSRVTCSHCLSCTPVYLACVPTSANTEPTNSLRSLLRSLPPDAIIPFSNVLRCFTRRHFDTFESNGA